MHCICNFIFDIKFTLHKGGITYKGDALKNIEIFKCTYLQYMYPTLQNTKNIILQIIFHIQKILTVETAVLHIMYYKFLMASPSMIIVFTFVLTRT